MRNCVQIPIVKTTHISTFSLYQCRRGRVRDSLELAGQLARRDLRVQSIERLPQTRCTHKVKCFTTPSCLSHYSVALKRHYNQGRLNETPLNRACLQFLRVSPWSLWQGVWWQAWHWGSGRELPSYPPSKRQDGWDWVAWVFQASKPTLRDTPSPTKPSILPKQFYQLGTKHSNIWTYGAIRVQTIRPSSVCYVLLLL